MPRCIVLIRSHEPLQEGWRKRAFGPAGPLLDDRVRVAGVRFDETYHPVQVWRRVGGGDDPPAASGFNYGGVAPAATYAVRVEAEDEDAIQRLRRDRQPEIVGVFADPAVSPFPSAYCGAAAIGATADVSRRLGVPTLSRAGLTGSGVHVARVDTGIDGSPSPVAGACAPIPTIRSTRSRVPWSRRARTCSLRRGTVVRAAPTGDAARAIRAPAPRSTGRTLIPTSSPWRPSPSRTEGWVIRRKDPARSTPANPTSPPSVPSRARASIAWTGARPPRARLRRGWRPRSASGSRPIGWRRRSSRDCYSGRRGTWGATAGTMTWAMA